VRVAGVDETKGGWVAIILEEGRFVRDDVLTPVQTRFEELGPVEREASAGRGDDVRIRSDGVVGSALELDGELLQLSAFTSNGRPEPTRIARPSRRR
jgi:hypothetical protein